MRRTFQTGWVQATLFACLLGLLAPAGRAEDAYYYVPISSAVPKERLTEVGERSGLIGEEWHRYAALEGEGEVYVHVTRSGEGFLTVRAPAAKPVRGLFFAEPDEAPIPFTILADKAAPESKRQFHDARWRHYQELLLRESPGAAWFRHQEAESLKASGSNVVDQPDRFPFRQRPDLFDGDQTFDLFSGGRAVSENLQLDRVLRAVRNEQTTVSITNISGITVREMNWAPLLKSANPTLDSLSRYIPADQHALFFPSFNAMTAVMDEADSMLTPLVHLLEPRSEDATTRERYQKQLCLELNEISRALGPRVITSVAMTGSDPYLASGSDVAVLFETKNPNILRTYVVARQSAIKQTNSSVKDVTGEVEGVTYSGVESPDRSISSFVAALDDALFVSNSRYQIAVLIKAAKGKTPVLAAQPEYSFFRSRYSRSEPDEAAFLILTDATIRRWCGPRWRIGNSRRVRAAAVLSELQAAHMDELAHGSVKPQSVQAEPRTDTSGQMLLSAAGISSDLYGTLKFLTPIAELALDRVTVSERDAYNAWRDGYQRNWRQYFDPIAVRLTMNARQITGEITVVPLINSSDYNQFVDFTRGGRIAPGAGDRHSETVMHFAMAINPESRLMHEASGLFNSPNSPIRANPLGWLGSAISIYADQDAFWPNLAKAVDTQRFFKTNYYMLPLALQCEVKNPLGLAAFLTGLRSKVDETAPGMVRWENRDYNGQTYVKVTAARPAVGNGDAEEEFSFDRMAVYYAVTPQSLTITVNEGLLKRAVDRQPGRNAKRAEAAGDGSGKPWLGTNLCLQLDRQFLAALEKMSFANERTSQQRLCWNNLPILNEWKRLYPAEDPVRFHEKFWNVKLVCPGGGEYVWNEKRRTMESTVYGHPGEPKQPAKPASRLGKFANANLGLTFENQGLSAKAVLKRETPQ